MTALNPNGQADSVLNILEGANDKVGACSINGGNVQVQGSNLIGNTVDQINTEGNTVVLSSQMVDDDFATNPANLPNSTPVSTWLSSDFSLLSPTAAAYQSDPFNGAGVGPPGSAAVTMYLSPGTTVGSGFASGSGFN